MLLRVLAALLLLSAAARAALNCDDLREAPAAAEDAITQQDMCSLCQEIVRNRYRWDWQTHEEALLAGLPSKFENTWGRYFACELKKCPTFATGSCELPTGDAGSPDRATLVQTPCFSKYVCYNCLKEYFPQQFAGCLDGLYDRI